MEGTEVLAPLAHEAAMLEHLVKQSAAANAPTVEQHALRRSMVRALFAFIEATIWVNKQFAIRFAVAQDREAGRSTPTFDVGEVAMLREESYDLGDRGQVKLRGARVSLCDNFKFMARAQAKVHGTDYDSVVTGRGVDMLKQAIRVRDRLTHPKVARDLQVADAELVNASNAFAFVTVAAGTLARANVPTPQGGWPWSQ